MSSLCEYCKKKKVGIMPFSCKCDYKNLCTNCRFPDQHKCTFDYKKEWREKLEKANPVVVKDKLERID